MINRVLLFYLLLISIPSFAQVGIGQWRDHLPYANTIAVAEGDNNRIYCATPYGAFYYDINDHSVSRLNRVSGLSDVNVSSLNYDKESGYLVIAYTNGNIDLYKNDIVFNISDIKRKNMVGSKRINRITFRNKLCYLSCDFGIVVLDPKRKEIKDTYFIGPDGSALVINDFTYDDSLFYAATDKGLYSAKIDNPFLSDFSVWTKDLQIKYPNAKYNTLAIRKGHLYINMSNDIFGTDTVFEKYQNQWMIFFDSPAGPNHRLKTYADTLLIVSAYSYTYYWNNMSKSFRTYNYSIDGKDITPQPSDVIFDKRAEVWIADKTMSLVYSWKEWEHELIKISGPPYENAHAITASQGQVWVASGGIESNWGNRYLKRGYYEFHDEKWTSYNRSNTDALDTIQDVMKVLVNPSNANEVFIATWGKGLIKMNDGKVSTVYGSANSTLLEAVNYKGFIGIAGLAYDKDGNLWVTNTANPQGLHMRSPHGKWQSFNLAPLVSSDIIGDLVIDHEGQKWIIMPRGHGIIVYNDNHTLDNVYDDKKKRLSQAVGNGNLPSSDIHSLAVDHDGEVWVGTGTGVAVFYSPAMVFSGANFDSQQIYIEQEGISQYLLQSEIVTAIAIDGANRKWFGTRKAGVFLMSEDGTKQIHHFTQENSALISDNIFSIAIDGQSGEVFIGTENGIVSFRSDATEGLDYQQDTVQVFPNPVRPDYNGPIAINGLYQNAEIRISDAYGNVVYEGKAFGGQAVWNGKNYAGERVMSGVYFVFSSNEDGEQTKVAKILFIH
jgi:ligand-binding sensor domain-containing protein